MMINVPSLPPRAGYVEVSVNGRHTYRNAVTGLLIEEEAGEPSAEEDLMGMAVDHELRLSLLELEVS